MARLAVSLLLMGMVMVEVMVGVTVMGAALPHVDKSEESRRGREKRSTSSEAEWSIWFNSDRPWTGEGDFETTDSIQKTQRICDWDEQVVSAQCRVAGTNDTFDSTTAAFVKDHLLQACSSHGLICLNSQQQQQQQQQQSSPYQAQKQHLCNDYEVRFLCQDIDTGDDNSLFPNFDFKIYILLAAVPLLVVTLRIVWSCCCKPHIKRRRQQLQNSGRQRRSSEDSGTLSTSSSQASIDSTLAQPPPAYTDLFGEMDLQQLQQLQQQNRPVIFSISGGECVGCGKCLHQAHVTDVGGVRLLTSGEGGEGEPGPSSPVEDDVFISAPSRNVNVTTTRSSDTPDVAANSQSRSTQRRSSDVALTSQKLYSPRRLSELARRTNISSQRRHSATSLNLFAQRRPSFTSLNRTIQRRGSGVVLAEGTATQPNSATSPASTLRQSLPSGTSLAGAVALPVTPLTSATSSEVPTNPQFCTCACHKRQSGHLNLAFHWDSSDPVDSPAPPVVYPGMHKPVFGFSRIGSVTSFTSFTSITELPDYEEALEILKKSGLFMEAEEEEEKEKGGAVP